MIEITEELNAQTGEQSATFKAEDGIEMTIKQKADEFLLAFADGANTVLEAYPEIKNFVTVKLTTKEGGVAILTFQRVGEGFITPAEKLGQLRTLAGQLADAVERLGVDNDALQALVDQAREGVTSI